MVLRSTPVRAGQRFPEPLAPLSLNKRVRVSACKIRMPDTHVFVPTLHKSFLDDLLESKKLTPTWNSRVSWLVTGILKEISTTPLIQGNPSNCDKGHMQPYSSKKSKRVAWILRSRSRKQLKRIKLTENVAFIMWFVRIKLDNKVKIQPFRQNQAKRVVPITYHCPITKNLVCIISQLNLFSWNTIKKFFTESLLPGSHVARRLCPLLSPDSRQKICARFRLCK